MKAEAAIHLDSAPVLVVPSMYAILKPDRKMVERRALLRRSEQEQDSGAASDTTEA